MKKRSKNKPIRAHRAHFIEYVASEVVALIFDIVLLWVLVRFFEVNYLVAATIAYIIAIMIHYHTTRHHIFKGTIRTEFSGFAYFLAVGIGGLLIALPAMNLIISRTHLDYLVARSASALLIIPATYMFNKYLNFVMPKPLPKEGSLYCNIPNAHGE